MKFTAVDGDGTTEEKETMTTTKDFPEWLQNPHPVNSDDWWRREQAIWEIVNDAGAFFDNAGNRIRKGEYSDLCDEVAAWRRQAANGSCR
jgi:hypothetical protein